MNWLEQCPAIQNRIFRKAQYRIDKQIKYLYGDSLIINDNEDVLQIQAPDLSGACRGLFISACALKEGKPVPKLEQTRHIATCGMMVDVSRGGVLKVDTVKDLIDSTAALGLNMMMLYTEDIYTIDKYPYFGYLRGRYSKKELQEIDRYAYECGVELIPCIQTLAHMEQFLQWDAQEDLRDNDICLLADEPKVYDFIREEIETVKQCFRSTRIHIGMDEAHGIGLGKYLEIHGMQNRYDILLKHLNRVVDICEQAGLKPIMWSDMFYRLGSKTNDYYDPNAIIPKAVIDQIPEVALCYWDYYHDDEFFYDEMMKGHKKTGRELVFAGGIWTWSGFLPHVKLTEATTYPALRACLKNNVQTVLATMWGDDGCETDVRLAISQLPLFSEHVWYGLDCTKEFVDNIGEKISGLSVEAYQAMGSFYQDDKDHRPGKGLFYTDPLYPLIHEMWNQDGYSDLLQNGIEVLSQYQDKRCEYATLLLTIALKKERWISELRPAYIRGDKKKVNEMVLTQLPELRFLYQQFFAAWRKQWEEGRKRNGWETACYRIGGILARLDDVEYVLKKWITDEISVIDELKDEPLPASRRNHRDDHRVLTYPQYI